MREIKFRVWNKRINQLSGCDDIYFTQEPLNEAFKFDEYVFMQYTGLKDKNGKEIYEGDVVEYRTYMQDEVKWQDDTSGFYPFADSPENCGCCGTGVNPKGSKVIGNIYENPDLLERIK